MERPATGGYIESMPKGPKGQKRPADVIGNAVHVMRVATGEIDEATANSERPEIEFARLGGKKGGAARAAKLSSTERSEIARIAAMKRWEKKSPR